MTVADVKRQLRITHTLLDNDIDATITEAREELVRAGVSETAANGEAPLVERAILTYCLAMFSNETKAERYEEAFRVQLDNLRKSLDYSESSESEE